MRRTVSLLSTAVAVGGLYVAVAATPAAAELGCPDTMTLTPTALVRQGEKKDRNANTFVCTKPTSCISSSGPICHGGPDDTIYGGPPLLSTDGTQWLYVVDDV